MVAIVSYEIDNDVEFQELLGKVSKISTSRFVMGEAARIIKKFSKANFILKGDGQYPPLSDRYKKAKSRLRPNAPILVYDGKLRDSIVGKTKDSILNITEDSLIVGTSLFYARFLDEGTKKMPARKPLFLTRKMIEQIIKTYDAHIEKRLNTI
jgi:phage gpG-like protein